MSLTKSLLLGSAAGLVAVAGAQAADLPTRKAAPAEYVRICTVNGVTGFVIPGSDTCLKISGYVTGQVTAGNLKTGYTLNYPTAGKAKTATAAAVAAKPLTVSKVGTKGRDDIGYTTRANLTLDVVSNTAYGPLLGHIEIQSEQGSGFDTTGTATYINRAYVQWAGITAGKANSFFSFTGGGLAWANIFSPDRKGFNQPDLLAYTATFGGGFSATLSLEDPQPGAGGGNNDSNVGGTQYTIASNATYNGLRSPDVVGNLHLDQGWGSAQVSGVAHNVNVTAVGGPSKDSWGYAFDAGITFKLPQIGPGDELTLTGAWSKNAIWYSGLADGMWGEPGGQVNGNGLGAQFADTFYVSKKAGWATPTAWSVTGLFNHHFSPSFSLGVEGSYGQLNWSNTSLLSNDKTWIIGGVAHWDPVANLDFEFELLYQNSKLTTPGDYTKASVKASGPFPTTSDGFAARFEVTRAF